jgi:hypothetical protein
MDILPGPFDGGLSEQAVVDGTPKRVEVVTALRKTAGGQRPEFFITNL